jgi:hypothetical protein
MCVDSTDLLNKRHLNEAEADGYYLSHYPNQSTSNANREDTQLAFDTITVYRHNGIDSNSDGKQVKHVCVVSYGNGIGAAKLARSLLHQSSSDAKEGPIKVTVVDCPYLSGTPEGLVQFMEQASVNKEFDAVVFADVCKETSGMPLLGIANNLNNRGLLRSFPYSVIGEDRMSDKYKFFMRANGRFACYRCGQYIQPFRKCHHFLVDGADCKPCAQSTRPCHRLSR